MISRAMLIHILTYAFTGKFQDDYDQAAVRFLKVSHGMDGDMVVSDSGKFDWPR